MLNDDLAIARHTVWKVAFIALAALGVATGATGAEEGTTVEEARSASAPETADAAALPEPAIPEATALLTLEQAQRAAVENNPSFGAAAARVDQARSRVDQARSLYFPSLDASYTATHTHLSSNVVRDAKRQALAGPLTSVVGQGIQQSAFSGFSATTLQSVGLSTLSGLYSGLQARNAIDEEVDTYTASLQASYIIFDGFGRHYNNAMARFGRRETEAARDEVYRILLDAVAQSYYGVQLARENVAIAEADEAFNQRLLKEARLRRERGTGSKSDVLNFEVLLRAAQAARIRAESDRAIARVALAALMGRPEAELGEEVVVAPLADETVVAMEAPDARDPAHRRHGDAARHAPE